MSFPTRAVKAISCCVLAAVGSLVFALAAQPMANEEASTKLLEPFPLPQAGMKRYVVSLPAQEDEYSFRVELQIGKKVETDSVNRYFFGGNLETETIQGWGYDYVILRQLGPMAGTRMAVYPEAAKVKRFVTLGGVPELKRYNSRLPLVVYVPRDVEVKYRVWKADDKVECAKEG